MRGLPPASQCLADFGVVIAENAHDLQQQRAVFLCAAGDLRQVLVALFQRMQRGQPDKACDHLFVFGNDRIGWPGDVDPGPGLIDHRIGAKRPAPATARQGDIERGPGIARGAGGSVDVGIGGERRNRRLRIGIGPGQGQPGNRVGLCISRGLAAGRRRGRWCGRSCPGDKRQDTRIGWLARGIGVQRPVFGIGDRRIGDQILQRGFGGRLG